MSKMLLRPMCSNEDVKEALALHKPCRQIYVPSFQFEKKFSPGVLIYNWSEERHKYRNNNDPTPRSTYVHDFRIPCDAQPRDTYTPLRLQVLHQRGAMPNDQFFRHHGKAYDCNKITWYDEIFNGRRMWDEGGSMRFPEERDWSLTRDAWRPEHSDYPLQGDPTNWGLWEKMQEDRRKLEKADPDLYASVYSKSYNRHIPPGSYQLTRYATPRQTSFKMSQVDRTLWDLEMARGKQPELLAQPLPDKSPAVCQPRHPPVTLFD